MEVYVGITPSQQSIVTAEDKQRLMGQLIAKSNWRNTTTQLPLHQAIHHKDFIVIRTEGLLVLDFDTDSAFQQALALNNTLHQSQQCQLITRSKRKGGHFYYTPNPDLELPTGHTKQSVIDIQTGPKKCVVPPSLVEQGKEILFEGDLTTLTKYPIAMHYLVTNIVLANMPSTARVQILQADDNRRSDNAIAIAQGYLSNSVTQEQFNTFYNLPDPIPPGQSNEVYLRLSTRLASDLTINPQVYTDVMVKYNAYTGRKTIDELENEIMRRMLTNANSLFRYDPDALTRTLTLEDRRTKIKLFTYMVESTGEHITEGADEDSRPVVTRYRTESLWLSAMEKKTPLSKTSIRTRTKDILTIKGVTHNYSKQSGYLLDEQVYNIAFHNSYLSAFNGAKPSDYSEPTKLIEMMEYMWGEEFNYLLDITKYRYTTFAFSPVVTLFKGSEGSGKTLSIDLLTAGFNSKAQTLNYQRFKDKHANWQVQDNAVFDELGDWRHHEKEEVLSEMKSVSGSNGVVANRRMQQQTEMEETIIKIWHTSNSWVKLHTDPTTQRRIHVVHMPRPLASSSGGPYSNAEIDLTIKDELLNFYYWLGNDRPYSDEWRADHYFNAACRQHTALYELYIENTQSKADRIASLLAKAQYGDLLKALSLVGRQLKDLTYKKSRNGALAVTTKSLRLVFGPVRDAEVIFKNIEVIQQPKRLKFDGSTVERFIYVYGDIPEQIESSWADAEVEDISCAETISL